MENKATQTETDGMKAKADLPRIRISLPFWGIQFAQRVVNFTIPALLAPGNLPALAAEFPIEVSLVTESNLFDMVSKSKAFQRLKEYADVRLVPLDDLLTGVAGDYGPVLTFALIRGYEDLGERMLDYYLMFLNADFIVANGSYRTLVRLIKKGHQVIHCPSFRGIYEEVIPVLSARTDRENAVLSMASREMVDLALRNKHLTVKARIVNQRLTHQWRMDQFYWYVDETTLIGYQWPIALVALRPERVVTRPKLMFDYGFIPEICPTAEKYYIGDSDEFFILEPQRKATGKDLVRLGWISPQAMAADLSKWTTKEHRECGQQMHVFHSGGLPADMSATVAESRRFVQDIVDRLQPANPHDDHPLFRTWWAGALQRMEDRRGATTESVHEDPTDAYVPLVVKAERVLSATQQAFNDFARGVYRWMFGTMPVLYMNHPLWLETHFLGRAFMDERAAGSRIFWVSDGDLPLNRLAASADQWVSPTDFLLHQDDQDSAGEQPFDVCVFDLTLSQCDNFKEFYAIAREIVGDGGRIYLSMTSTGWRTVAEDDIEFCEEVLPDKDQSTAMFSGGGAVRVLRFFFARYMGWKLHPLLRPFVIGPLLLGLAPVTYMANRTAAHRPSGEYRSGWLHMFARFRVVQPGHLGRTAGVVPKVPAEVA